MTTQGKILMWGIVGLIAVGGWWYLMRTSAPEVATTGSGKIVATSTTPQPFVIDGTPVTLMNGTSVVEAAPGSASKVTTKYFGNEVKADFNGDGIEDSAFLVTQNSGGSGTFFYLATSLGGPALVLGDRISPQTTEYINGKIIVNYADRKAGEPMTATPTVGMSQSFTVEKGILVKDLSVGGTRADNLASIIEGTYSCAASFEDDPTNDHLLFGTLHTDKGLVRGEFSSNYYSKPSTFYMIKQGNTMYTWNSENNIAMKSLPDDWLSFVHTSNCKSWTPDSSLFVLPTNLTFE
jgi:hypothetical protein